MAEKQWMTYSQIAERLGVTPDAITHRSRKEGWQRQEGNDGKIRVLIDPELLSEIPARSGSTARIPALIPGLIPTVPTEKSGVLMIRAKCFSG